MPQDGVMLYFCEYCRSCGLLQYKSVSREDETRALEISVRQISYLGNIELGLISPLPLKFILCLWYIHAFGRVFHHLGISSKRPSQDGSISAMLHSSAMPPHKSVQVSCPRLNSPGIAFSSGHQIIKFVPDAVLCCVAPNRKGLGFLQCPMLHCDQQSCIAYCT